MGESYYMYKDGLGFVCDGAGRHKPITAKTFPAFMKKLTVQLKKDFGIYEAELEERKKRMKKGGTR